MRINQDVTVRIVAKKKVYAVIALIIIGVVRNSLLVISPMMLKKPMIDQLKTSYEFIKNEGNAGKKPNFFTIFYQK
jgi:hypothetical protein